MTDRIYIQFADNGNIRKWQREPFDGGVPYLSSAIPGEVAELVERLRNEISAQMPHAVKWGAGEYGALPPYLKLADEAATALTSLAAQERAILEVLEHVTELLVDTWHVIMPPDNDPECEAAVIAARLLLKEG